MLKVNQLSKKFKENVIFSQVSFAVEPGQLVHISGENGSGKSTLFKVITGLLAPDAGSATIDSDDVIGALIENPGFLEYETAMTNLKFLADLSHDFNRTRIMELMQQFELDPNNRQAVSKYSVGMRQKLGIIQAVMENQNIVLLDEPTRGLDSDSVAQFILLLHNLAQANKAVIVASHDHVEGLNYDHAFVLKDGHLQDE